jgi:outer membrane PBP1 activator LpoA protein
MAQHFAQKETNARKNLAPPPASSNTESDGLRIHFFDTHTQHITELYETSHTENSLIIGPLDKTSLNQLSKLDTLNTRTLALNYLESGTKPFKNLYQFGLAPESETSQLADHIINKGLNKVAIIAPENNLGFRIYDAFITALSERNGAVIESSFYRDQASLSKTVAHLLGTDESKARKRKIQTISQLDLDFLPRRREDVDAIFMVAKPEIAKQLKPLFSYHYAGNIPVFATSQVHQRNSTSNNKDLNNIEFIEMPWMLSQTIDIKNKLNRLIPDSKSKYSRFYALGVDAYTLAPRLTLLQEIKDSQLQGQTGTLSIDLNGIVSRKMQWAKFKSGNAISIQD